MSTKSDTTPHDIYKNIVINLLVPLLFLIMAGMGSWLVRLDNRMYEFQGNAVTDTKLVETEQRMMRYMDVRLNDLENKLQIVIRHLEKLGDKNVKED